MTEIKYLQIETTTVCNAHCVMCPHSQVAVGTMNDDLFKKVADDAGQYDLRGVFLIGTGEPFCDPQFLDRLTYLRTVTKPETKLCLYTNGSLITDEQIGTLALIPDVEVVFSLNGSDDWSRKKITGLEDFGEAYRKMCLMSEKGINVTPQCVFHPSITNEEMTRFAAIKGHNITRFQSFGGNFYPYRRITPTSCWRVIAHLMVKWDGIVSQCCYDLHNILRVGDMNKNSLAEIWNNEMAMSYRRLHLMKKGEAMPLCDSCTECA
jgi:MoaA/NifB/PqqE/SkfB family radical SAM enzyme